MQPLGCSDTAARTWQLRAHSGVKFIEEKAIALRKKCPKCLCFMFFPQQEECLLIIWLNQPWHGRDLGCSSSFSPSSFFSFTTGNPKNMMPRFYQELWVYFCFSSLFFAVTFLMWRSLQNWTLAKGKITKKTPQTPRTKVDALHPVVTRVWQKDVEK